MTSDLLTCYQVTKNFTAGYIVTDPFRAAGGLRIRLLLCALNSSPGFYLHKNQPVQQFSATAPSVVVFEDSMCPFGFAKGASGSWAEPYFACPTLRYGGLAYPPGILDRLFTGKRKEKRIPGGILYKQLKAYTAICQQKINDGRY